MASYTAKIDLTLLLPAKGAKLISGQLRYDSAAPKRVILEIPVQGGRAPLVWELSLDLIAAGLLAFASRNDVAMWPIVKQAQTSDGLQCWEFFHMRLGPVHIEIPRPHMLIFLFGVQKVRLEVALADLLGGG